MPELDLHLCLDDIPECRQDGWGREGSDDRSSVQRWCPPWSENQIMSYGLQAELQKTDDISDSALTGSERGKGKPPLPEAPYRFPRR